ncbi:flagellar biosynthesis protein FlgA [Rhodococcus rhodnii]|uniref:SAF domain-containing protein n=2 Tax=Rhodococcus rhodnii TaxID=38312 RepID=R7WQN0_9NOCA|nr:SAF domain-containing protein [Rhodococcus rhodnii]EOM77626.1 hypothetical protein Rrhod_1037 [Rhodococcus rhodnii LMG 5362]TXG90207.1 flagellar biosynthesis protein FlgA [Rhodococcus rhodnii]
MPRTLAPSLLDRLHAFTHPHWARAVLVRRVAAGVLAALALVLALQGDRDGETATVVVAARDLAPGTVVGAEDVTAAQRVESMLPAGAVVGIGDVEGRTLAGPVRAGEILTDVRVVSPRLAQAATGDGAARVVPVRLADAGVVDLLREGDRVDVLSTTGDDERSAEVVASNAVVVLVDQGGESSDRRDRMVMLALPGDAAERVAVASLTEALAVTLA